MAVYSMTGYASVHTTLAQPGAPASSAPALRVELRSVNNRFLDLSLRLPDSLQATEASLRECVSQHLRRGKVELRVHLERENTNGVSVPNAQVLSQLAQAQAVIQSQLPEAAPLSVSQVLQLGSQAQTPAQDATPALLALVTEGVLAMKAAREREGARLVDMLRERTAALRALAEQAQPMVPQLIEQQRQRFLDKFNAALGDTTGVDTTMAQERALSEATAYAIRIDVAEELTRLASHLDEIDHLLAQGGELGKRLDFLIQELHREANTLGSKSSTLALTRISVDMKVSIEQMREQVQNIE
jgi:uncharacterized protein (TIGR00255 family)